MLNKKILILFFAFITYGSFSQSTFPIYTDYLSDNVFLLHPSAAGIGNCAKLRLTHRQQWNGISEGPSLQTLSFHSRISEKAALGGVLFNDKNGFHAQKGIAGSYAYHLNFGRDDALNQLSFGMSFTYVINTIDQSSFTSVIPDPSNSQIIESTNYFNTDFSTAYHFMDTYAYFTVKNLLLSTKGLENSSYDSLNLRSYLLTLGYYFGKEKSVQFEPSVMLQMVERTSEFSVDVNLKAYKNIDNNKQIWAALSYRQNLEKNAVENLKQITPIVGFNYKRYMASYTYTNQLNQVVLDNSGFHQITLGMNMFCKKQRATGCPNVNSIF
ncbi:PorP/SprF family type IX secretion system membrane protein [Aureibaculum luteum]|uniref:PorP/SprF family type IX secretion system membrane protein n=1 Tax=Aureibaculum luteum TaxID=1548456 RepID=UPI000E4AD354|nr:type IX secretion system membrane protein PorP/SprF [Aureibaculum luteum]